MLPQAFDPELVEFLESGVSLLVGTCDAHGVPSCSIATGARVEGASREVTIYLTERLASRVVDNLRENPRIAVTFSRTLDHRSLQLKGDVLSIEKTDEAGKLVQESYLERYAAALVMLGFPKDVANGIAYFPSLAVKFRTTGLFEQTPGPRAGNALTSG